MITDQLHWGYKPEPVGAWERVMAKVRAAWGARLIEGEVRTGGTGIVWDRQDCVGDDTDRQELLALLNSDLGAKRIPDGLRAFLDHGWLEDDVHSVYSDAQVCAWGRRAGGYLYVTVALRALGGGSDS